MSRPPTLFVSFSGKDQHGVRRLLASLQLQGLNFWDYSKPSQELPLARHLDTELAKKIDACDYFLAIVTANTTNPEIGRNTHFEVQYALDRGLAESDRLLPVLFLNELPEDWLGPYRKLQSLMRVEVDAGKQDSVEDAVRRVCGYLSIDYSPPLLNDPRVFFSQRFTQEVEDADATPLSNDQFLELTQTILRCAEHSLKADWSAALEEITLFMLYSNSKITRPEQRFYYPQVLKGVCELQLGEYAEAERTFLAAARHPKRDELCFAGLGHTYYAQERYEDARSQFETALSINPSDEDIKLNLMGTLFEVGEPTGEGEILKHYDALELTPEERFKVNKMKAIILHGQGRYHEAAEVFSVVRLVDMDDACADYYSSALEECGRSSEAIAVLCDVAERLRDTNLYHILAHAYLRMGEIGKALGVYESELCRPTCWTRQFLIEYARILKAFGTADDQQRVRELCETVLSPSSFSNAEMKKEDFFYMGFSNYLLGRHDRARYDFELSSNFSDKYYDDPEYALR